ncbi:MAG: hypothetical protein LBF83_05335 [Spirochaetaceae bacterium]|jgi:hypothetical protein|nr:hypothetical protein [Spirochaetaceae bacterium]
MPGSIDIAAVVNSYSGDKTITTWDGFVEAIIVTAIDKCSLQSRVSAGAEEEEDWANTTERVNFSLGFTGEEVALLGVGFSLSGAETGLHVMAGDWALLKQISQMAGWEDKALEKKNVAAGMAVFGIDLIA